MKDFGTWRNNAEIWQRCREWLLPITKRRQEEGKKYGPNFVGNPLRHLEEELVDALFYSRAESDKLEFVTMLLGMGVSQRDWSIVEEAYKFLKGEDA